jgi:hypothetical protein
MTNALRAHTRLPHKQTSVERLAMVWMSTEIRDCICDLTHLSTCIRLLHTCAPPQYQIKYQ